MTTAAPSRQAFLFTWKAYRVERPSHLDEPVRRYDVIAYDLEAAMNAMQRDARQRDDDRARFYMSAGDPRPVDEVPPGLLPIIAEGVEIATFCDRVGVHIFDERDGAGARCANCGEPRSAEPHP